MDGFSSHGRFGDISSDVDTVVFFSITHSYSKPDTNG
jgi:hypothetical protein